jgi:hypothetical protein
LVDTVEDAWVSYGVIREDVDRFADFLRTHVVKDGAKQDDNIRAIVEAFVFRERLRPTEPPPEGRAALQLVARRDTLCRRCGAGLNPRGHTWENSKQETESRRMQRAT